MGWRQMVIGNPVSNIVDIINVFYCRLSGVRTFIMDFVIKYIQYSSHVVAPKCFNHGILPRNSSV